MKCTHSTYDKLLTYKTPCHLFVDPKKFWMTFRQVESKYVHILKSYSSEVLFSLTCSDLYTCSDESHPLGFVVEPFFFFSIFVHFTQTGIHADTTMGCVVSVKSVHVDPAETDLATICTYWDK